MLNTQLKLNKLSQVSRTNVLSSGFTLIELLVVIVILAILAVAVIVAINPAQRIAAANNSTIKSNISSWASSAGAYAAEFGTFPYEFDDFAWNPSTLAVTTSVWNVGSSAAKSYTVGGVVYTYASADKTGDADGTCNKTSTSCGAMSISAPVNAGDSSTGLWCFQSNSGSISNPPVATGCKP